MREILFRAKSKCLKEFVYGYYSLDKCGDFEGMHWISDDNGILRYIYPETLGQFVGLTDKRGTKIFEGDILVIKGDEEELYQVKFDECCFQLYGETVCYVMDNFYDHDLEVIGNIHDNPELLGGGEKE